MKFLLKNIFLLLLILIFNSSILLANLTVTTGDILEENLQSHADETATENLEAAFLTSAKHFNVPVGWSKAIAKVESGLKPWALNIEGKGYFFENKKDALAAANKAFSENKSFDSGLMQINSWWLKKYNIPLEAALDPEANIYLANFILSEEIKKHGETAKAIGAYHSPTSEKANNYAKIVLKQLENPSSEKIKFSAKKTVKKSGVQKKITNKNKVISPEDNRNILAYSSKKAILKTENESFKITLNNKNFMKNED